MHDCLRGVDAPPLRLSSVPLASIELSNGTGRHKEPRPLVKIVNEELREELDSTNLKR